MHFKLNPDLIISLYSLCKLRQNIHAPATSTDQAPDFSWPYLRAASSSPEAPPPVGGSQSGLVHLPDGDTER